MPLQFSFGRSGQLIYKTSDEEKSWKLTHKEVHGLSNGRYLLRSTDSYVFRSVDGKNCMILKTVNKKNLGLRILNSCLVVLGEAGFAARQVHD